MKIIIIDLLLFVLFFLNRRNKLSKSRNKAGDNLFKRIYEMVTTEFASFGLLVICSTLMVHINVNESNFFIEVLTTAISYLGYLLLGILIIQQIVETIEFNKAREERANARHTRVKK